MNLYLFKWPETDMVNIVFDFCLYHIRFDWKVVLFRCNPYLMKMKTTKLRKKSSMQLLRECWSFLTKLITCQNLQNKLLNITVLFIWYLLQIVGEFKKNVIRQTWQALFHSGEYLYQSTRHFGECLKNMVSHTIN